MISFKGGSELIFVDKTNYTTGPPTLVDVAVEDDDETTTIPHYDDNKNENEELELLYKSDNGCISRENKLIYVHVPKTGGSTIERSDLFKDARRYHKVGGHPSITSMTKKSSMRGNIKERYVKAAHIRNPCERFISAFYFLKQGPERLPWDIKWSNEFIQNKTIDEFVSTLVFFKKNPHLIKRRGKNNTKQNLKLEWDNKFKVHFKHQYKFLYYDNKSHQFGLDVIMCQEDWDEGLERLYKRIGYDNKKQQQQNSTTMITTTTERKRRRRRRNNNNNKQHNNKSTTMARKNDNKDHKSCSDLSESTRHLLENYLYEMDFCIFQYGKYANISNDDLYSFLEESQRRSDVKSISNKQERLRLLFVNDNQNTDGTEQQQQQCIGNKLATINIQQYMTRRYKYCEELLNI